MEKMVDVLKDIYSIYFMLLIFGTAVWLIFFDYKYLSVRGLSRDAKFSRYIGIFYLALGIVYFVFAKISE